jgi:anti-sigma factor RsiW
VNNEHQRSDIETLLPWYAAGTLGRNEAAEVEQALADDAELVRRLALIREECAATVAANESLGGPSARAADKLFAAIAAEPRGPLPLARRALGELAAVLQGSLPGRLSRLRPSWGRRAL